MAFLDETGLAELWSLVKAEDGKRAKIEFGSYVGTGTAGASDPTMITFSFAPKVVWVYARASGSAISSMECAATKCPIIPMDILSTAYTQSAALGESGYGNLYGKKSADGKTVYFYNDYSGSYGTNGASFQYNLQSMTYYYLAIG